MSEDGVGSTLMRLIHSLSAASDSGSEREEEKLRLEARFKESDARVDDLVALNRVSLTAVTKSYALVSRKLSIARKKIAAAKMNLLACRELLHYKRDELKRLWLDGFEQKHIFVMLEKIEIIKECPEVIEGLLAKKKMIEATKCLVGHLDSLENELKNVEGLTELKGHLLTKKDALYRVIMEDLNYQLYVRSTHDMFALRRQASLRESGQFIRTPSGGCQKTLDKQMKDRRVTIGSEPSFRKWNDHCSSYLNGRLLSVAEEEEWMRMLENPLKVNMSGGGPPSALIVYVECLTQLNLLPTALDQLRNDLRSELMSIIRKTSKQILDLYPNSPPTPNSDDRYLFLELFNSLVEQFYLVVDAYRLLSIAINASSARHGTSIAPLETPLIWESVQNSVKNILSDYLIFKDKIGSDGGMEVTGSNGNSQFPGKASDYFFLKKRTGRTRKMSLFKFDHSSTALNMNDYAKEQRSENNLQSATLVCAPNPHNITSIYPSLMEFISEIDKSLDPNSHCSLYTFLSDYVKEDFLQVINFESSEDLSASSLALSSWETETELESLKSLRSSRPLLRSTIIIKRSLDRLLSIMNTLYLYRVHFFNNICKIVSEYRDIVEKAFRGLLRGEGGTGLKPGGELASDEDILRLNKSFPIWDSSSGRRDDRITLKDVELLNKREIFLIKSKVARGGSLDILPETGQLVHLGSLCESLDWFAGQISTILTKTTNVPEKSLASLHAVASKFSDLSSTILLVLHLEVRLHALHYLGPLLSGPGAGFSGGSEAPDASPEVLRLASDLTAAEDALSPILGVHKGVYVFEGILYMLGSLLIYSSQGFKRIDGNGIKKMSRNLFTLQYILSSYISGHGEVELEAAKQYFELLSKSPEDIINGIVEKGNLFSNEEYENAIRLLHRSTKGSTSDQLENDLKKLSVVLKMNS